MSGKKETNVKLVAFRFDLMDDKSRKAYEFIKSFNRKQSNFIIALLLWYSEYSEEYKLTFLPDERKIIDLSKMRDFLEPFGISKSESEKIIGNYSSNQLAYIRDFLKEIEKTRNNTKETEGKVEEKNTINADGRASGEEVSLPPMSGNEPTENSEDAKRDQNFKNITENNDVHNENVGVMSDVDDDGEDDWLLNMAGVPSN